MVLGQVIKKVWSTLEGDKLVAYMARISNPTNQNNEETSSKLINYLIKNKHWSPFEMVNLVVEINTTRDIGRQILRHRSFTFQEFSQRYSSVESLGEPIYRECRMQDNKNRQSSTPNRKRKYKSMVSIGSRGYVVNRTRQVQISFVCRCS